MPNGNVFDTFHDGWILVEMLVFYWLFIMFIGFPLRSGPTNNNGITYACRGVGGNPKIAGTQNVPH